LKRNDDSGSGALLILFEKVRPISAGISSGILMAQWLAIARAFGGEVAGRLLGSPQKCWGMLGSPAGVPQHDFA